jgi:hypothetical protein
MVFCMVSPPSPGEAWQDVVGQMLQGSLDIRLVEAFTGFGDFFTTVQYSTEEQSVSRENDAKSKEKSNDKLWLSGGTN